MANLKCIFCKIIAREEPAEIFYEDDEIVVFRDIKPASQHHYLVIPKRHIKAANCLRNDDLPLLQRMIEIGKRVLIENNGDPNDVRLGFHWPPFNSIPHLHLHVISPVAQLGFLARQIYKPDTFWFVSTEYMLNYLHTSNL